MQKAKTTIAMLATAIIGTMFASEIDLDRLGEVLRAVPFPGGLMIDYGDLTDEEYAMQRVGVFIQENGLDMNETCNAIYDILKRDWADAAMYTNGEYRAVLQAPRLDPRKSAILKSKRLESEIKYARIIPDETKREEIRLMALASSNRLIRSFGLEMTLETPSLSTNELCEIHDIFASSTNCAWDSHCLIPLSTQPCWIDPYPSCSNLWRKSNSDPLFKDRLNRLDWFIANMLPGLSTPFDERLVASVPGYETSMQRKNLYESVCAWDAANSKTNWFFEIDQPILDRLNAIPTNELNDVSAALSW